MVKRHKSPHFVIIGLLLLISFSLAAWLDYQASRSPNYLGLPTVACIDPTKPIVQDYSLKISVRIAGAQMPLPASLGHDYGNCLHAIHTDDSSGVVKVESNTSDPLTLGQFFDVWKLTFNDHQLGSHYVNGDHRLTVEADGQHGANLRDIQLKSGQMITVIYQ